MSQQIIDPGSTNSELIFSPRIESMRSAFQKVNVNFTELYAVVGHYATPEQFGGGIGSTAAQNDSAIAQCISSGLPIIFPNVGTYNINTTINLPVGTSIRGATNAGTIIQQNTSNTPIVIAGTAKVYLGFLTLQYATPQVAANTSAIGLRLDNLGPTGAYESRFEQLSIFDAAVGIGTVTYEEFQNIFDGIQILRPSAYGLLLPVAGGSGSVFNNIRIEGPSAQPGSATMTSAIYLQNYDNFVFNQVNIEKLSTSAAMFYMNSQSSGVINSLHFEQVKVQDFTAVVELAGQCDVTINNLTFVFSLVATANSNAFLYLYSNAGAVPNRLMLNGFLEHNNTFTARLTMLLDDGNFNIAYVRGVNARNTGNICVTSRNNLLQFEGYLFDVAGGRIRSGLASTTFPASGGMPSPFQSIAGVALGWVVGDRYNNTAPTAITTPGWICTTAGSPGTWTTEKPLG